MCGIALRNPWESVKIMFEVAIHADLNVGCSGHCSPSKQLQHMVSTQHIATDMVTHTITAHGHSI